MKRTSHAIYDLWYHLVWATKYRKKIFENNPKLTQFTKETLRAIALEYDMEIESIEIDQDQVHTLIEIPPRLAPARAAQILKSRSTQIIFKEFPYLRKQYYWGGELWVGGYFIKSVGQAFTKENIIRYIEEQGKARLFKM